MAERIDLNAARAARPAAEREPRVILFGDEEFTVPARWPITAIDAGRRGQLVELVQSLFGEQADAFLAHNPVDADLAALIDALSRTEGDSSDTAADAEVKRA